MMMLSARQALRTAGRTFRVPVAVAARSVVTNSKVCVTCVFMFMSLSCVGRGGGGGYKSWVQIDQVRGLEHRVCVTSSVLLWPAYDDKLLRICLPSSLYLYMNFDFQDQL